MLDNLKALFLGRKLSHKTAKNRLQMVLVQDRSGMTANDMDFFKRDLLEVISKYFVVETKNLNVEWQRMENSTALVINTPVVGKTKKQEPKLATAN
ncbi:MAG: cell division topological specificity factor MinE [Proteobacteria bacterium]|nr:cell division topological specificity factor MinE [Pseudomonadota bacterium]